MSTPSETPLNSWLTHKGLRANPFERWSAEHDQDLPNYFVDTIDFDNLQQLTEPCLVLAEQGCGKTAQRQMLAAQYRPLKPDSSRLAVNYTYTGFERILEQVNNDLTQVRAIHHVNAILRLGLTALLEAIPESVKQRMLNSLDIRPRLEAYVTRFTPHLKFETAPITLTRLDELGPVGLCQGFVDLIRTMELDTCVVLIDGLDEFPLTAGEPAQIARFLAPLLGTLPLVECPGLAFKFFLPQAVEPAQRDQDWFRPDRLHFFRLAWQNKKLLALIGQRLTYFSRRQPPYEGLGQLCEDRLGQVIDEQLVTVAQGLPRAALILASQLLQYHCQQPDPPDLISLKTWQRVKADWLDRRDDFVPTTVPRLLTESHEAAADPTAVQAGTTGLRVDEDKGLVWLDNRDITYEINPKEYAVLACLYRHRDGVCTKDTLIQEAWPEDEAWDSSDQAITQSIRRLRQALRQVSPGVDYIETVRGRGYRLHPGGF